jgi:transaldolase
MSLFLASTDIDKISKIKSLGLFGGIVTNPDAVVSSGRTQLEVARDVAAVSPGRAYFMIRDASLDAMKKEATQLIEIDPEVIGIKVALSPDGMRLIHWLLQSKATTDIMATCVAEASHVVLASELGVRWITPWGSLRAQSGGPAREAVLEEMQCCLEKLSSTTELVVGTASASALAALVAMRIRHAFVWEKDVEALIGSEWTRMAINTFQAAWEQDDQRESNASESSTTSKSNGY